MKLESFFFTLASAHYAECTIYYFGLSQGKASFQTNYSVGRELSQTRKKATIKINFGFYKVYLKMVYLS